jgi:hypothetical protein
MENLCSEGYPPSPLEMLSRPRLPLVEHLHSFLMRQKLRLTRHGSSRGSRGRAIGEMSIGELQRWKSG